MQWDELLLYVSSGGLCCGYLPSTQIVCRVVGVVCEGGGGRGEKGVPKKGRKGGTHRYDLEPLYRGREIMRRLIALSLLHVIYTGQSARGPMILRVVCHVSVASQPGAWYVSRAGRVYTWHLTTNTAREGESEGESERAAQSTEMPANQQSNIN